MASKRCVIDGCIRPRIARGWCTRHYQRWRNTGDPLGGGDKTVPNRHEVFDTDTGLLVITRSDGSEHYSLYDLIDHDLVAAHQWYLSHGYVVRNIQGGRAMRGLVHLHRAVLGIERLDPQRVDHISGDRLDNRKINLRIADARLNAQNQAVINELGSSRYRGVCWDEARGQWKAYTRIDGRMHNVGRFATEEIAGLAIIAYRAAHDIEPGYPQRHPGTPSEAKS